MTEFLVPKTTQNLGDTLPYGDCHAVSVVLPTWDDTVGWASRSSHVLDRMQTGYPRFFINRTIDALASSVILPIYDKNSKSYNAMLFPCENSALLCRTYLQSQASDSQINCIEASLLRGCRAKSNVSAQEIEELSCEVHFVVYPPEMFPSAKAFWQHTGLGISSRQAEMMYLGYKAQELKLMTAKDFDNFYGPKARLQSAGEAIVKRRRLEESEHGPKAIIRQRIADLASPPEASVSPKDVYLYPSGMTAINATAEAVAALKLSSSSSVINVITYGFLYLDTFKLLSKIYHFNTTLLGHSNASELDSLESALHSGTLHISALYCEFPTNPLLHTPNLHRLHSLSTRYCFLLICDDTIATTANVSLLPHVDILVTSLTKMFSGACNVMGGSLVLNPHSPHYPALSTHFASTFKDTYYLPDATLMEQNSRTFPARIALASRTAHALASLLQSHPAVSKVYYPTSSQCSTSLSFFNARKRPQGGYGYLLSVVFHRAADARKFFDALQVAKGPSLGTDFTLACPYTLFAHWGEREWASEYGVVEDLVRISVGLEGEGWVLGRVGEALGGLLGRREEDT